MRFKNQKELFQALLDGKKIQSSTWIHDDYAYLDKSDGIIKDSFNVRFFLQLNDPSLFHIYEESKPKVKIYLYSYYSKALCQWFWSGQYYANDDAFKLDHKNIDKFMKLENTCIEVDEE